MSDILRALSVSAGILLPIVVLIIIVGRVAVLRGEATSHADTHGHAEAVAHGVVTETKGGAAAAQKAAPAAAVTATQDVSVLEILGLGVALFVVAVIILFGISIFRHM